MSRKKMKRGKFIPAAIPGGSNVLTKDKRLELTYVPAASPEAFHPNRSYRRRGYRFGGKRFEFTWWNKGSFYTYPALLVSAAYGIKYPNFRKEFELPSELLFMGDSGGFQLVSIVKKKSKLAREAKSKEERDRHLRDRERIIKTLHPVKVLRWQERNCEVGFALDVPLVGKGEGYSRSRFEWSLGKSIKNYKMMVDNRKKMPEDGFLLYNVLHGMSIPQIEQWYEGVKDFPLDGWSLPIKPPGDALYQAFGLTFALSHGLLRNVHVLGVSGFEVIPTLIYATKWIENLTFDSATPTGNGAKYRGYHTPMNTPGIVAGNPSKWRVFFGEKSSGLMNTLPCDCPVCEQISHPSVFDEEGTAAGSLIALHNLYVFLRYISVLEAFLDDDKLFRHFIKSHCSPRTMRSIDIIDQVMKDPTPKTWEKVWHNNRGLLDVTQEKGMIRRGNLF